MREVQVMMLAAGFGTRLWPLTADRGKPAVPFLGQPLIRGLLDWLARHGAQRVVVNTHHRPASIRAALAEPPLGVEVLFSHEETILGTAGALAHALAEGKLKPDRTTLVVNAKLVTSLRLDEAYAAHRASAAKVTMVLRSNGRREAFTSVRCDGARVVGFGESRVPEGEHPLLFTGVHFLEPEVLRHAEVRFSDTVRDLYPRFIASGEVYAHVDDQGIWTEASTLERYLQLQIDTAGAAGFQASDARVDARAQLESVVLGPRAVIEADAVVRSSVLWPEARVGPGARLHRCVLGEGVRVPAGAHLDGVVAVRPELTLEPPESAPAVTHELGLALIPLCRPLEKSPRPSALDSSPGRRKDSPRFRQPPMKLRYAGLTHVGMKRTHNEDNLALLPEESLYIVADGMGGHASGEVASQMAVETIMSFFRMTTRDEEVTWPFKEEKNLRYDENRLVAAIKFSNQRIYEAAAREARFKGMGTTIVTAFFTQGGAYLGHVGDSRGYRLREGKIEQITDDHSLLNDYIKANKLTPEEIENFPHKNVIVRALGMKDTVQVDVNRLDPRPGDYYLLCSDGLSGMVTDERIRELTLATDGDLEKACEDLVSAANDAGGTDNITVAVVQFLGD